MEIKISDRWRLTSDRLQYILIETVETDKRRGRTKHDTKEISTFYTELGSVLKHIAACDTRTSSACNIKELQAEVDKLNKTLEHALRVLRDERLPYSISELE